MGKMVKIEDLETHYKKPQDALRYALMCLEKNDVSHARHGIRDALNLLGCKDVDIYPL